jgi:predicted AAA+ superfamily ATPase
MEILIQRFYEKYAEINTKIIRDFIHEVDWTNRFIGIKGGRGVGKTTLLLQYLKQNYPLDNRILYASLDHFFFSDNRLYDLANDFYKKGGELMVLDEVHRFPSWSVELKNIYDDFSGLKIVFTGSSLLHLSKATADLSRRVVMYEMPGLSLREFIFWETGLKIPDIKLDDLVKNHVAIALEIIPNLKPLVYFNNFLNYGHYPFYLENKSAFHQKLNEIIQVVLEIDIPQYENLPSANIVLLKKLLQVLSGSVPFKPNIQSISQRTGISVNTLKNYLTYLGNARIISSLYPSGWGLSRLSKPDKLYLHDTNMMVALTGNQQNPGNLRETFFMNQVSKKYHVSSVKETDFLVEDKYYFELGGKSKSKKQIQNLENAYVVMDDIEIGNDRIIPLWLFGLLY